MKYKPEELRPVGLVSRLPYILTARPNLPARSLGELVAYAKKQPAGMVTFGHIGPGSMIHLLGEQWGRKNGLSLNYVGYKGVPPVVQDLMGDQIDLTFLPLGGNTLALLESGKVKAIGTTAAMPSTKLQQVPSISASDKKLADFVYGTWIALLVPAKTPAAAVQRLNKAITNAMKDADLQTYITSTGMELAGSNTLTDLNKFYATDTRLYQGLARAIGVTPD